MSQVKVKSFVFELFGGKMCLTVMTLDNLKHCNLEQKLREISIFEEKPGKLRENVKYVA